MVKTEYHDPGYDDLSSEEFWRHFRYGIAESLEIHPSEVESSTAAELETRIEEVQGDMKYPEALGR